MSQPKSPTFRLLAGLAITLSALALYSGYTIVQLRGLERLQGGIIDRNRADSLLLLRIQNNLNSLGLAMRDMLDGSEPYPLTAWRGQFRRIRTDLEDALTREARSSPLDRDAEQRKYLSDSFGQFWDALDRIFALAESGQERRSPHPDPPLPAGPPGSPQHRGCPPAGAEQRSRAAGGRPHSQRLCRRRKQRLPVRRRHAGADPPHQPLPGLLQPPHFSGSRRALGAPQRTGAAVDRHAGKHFPFHLPRPARRFRPDPHRRRHHAAARRPPTRRDRPPPQPTCARSRRPSNPRSTKCAPCRTRCIR